MVLFGGEFLARSYWKTHPVLPTWSFIGVTFVFVMLIGLVVFWSIGHMRRMNREGTGGSNSVVRNFEYPSSVILLGWPLVHIRFAEDGGRIPVKAWIACGNIARGILFAYGGVAVEPSAHCTPTTGQPGLSRRTAYCYPTPVG